MTVNQWIKKNRKAFKYSQHELSEKASIHQGYLSRIENERESVSESLLEKMCIIFNEDYDEIKAKFTEEKEAVTHEISNNDESEMNQVQLLIDTLKQAQDNLAKAQEGINKQMEMNMKLVDMLHAKQDRPDYIGSLQKLEKRHDRIEERFDEILGYFNDYQKKTDQLETGT